MHIIERAIDHNEDNIIKALNFSKEHINVIEESAELAKRVLMKNDRALTEDDKKLILFMMFVNFFDKEKDEDMSKRLIIFSSILSDLVFDDYKKLGKPSKVIEYLLSQLNDETYIVLLENIVDNMMKKWKEDTL